MSKQKKEEVLQFICKYTDTNGFPPSYREIAAGVDLRSPSSVANYVSRLKQEGRIRNVRASKSRASGVARSVALQRGAQNVQRVSLKMADGGIVSFDCGIEQDASQGYSLSFSGILDATGLVGDVGYVVSCRIENA